MGRRNVIRKVKLVENEDMGSNVESKVIKVSSLDRVKFIIDFKGNAVGNFKFLISDDMENFYEIEPDITLSANGADDSHILNINLVNFTFIKILYEASSGFGTLNIGFTGNNIGA